MNFYLLEEIDTIIVCYYYTGSNIHLEELIHEPPRDGPTLWEIGIPDRSAAEFYVPDPNPMYLNKLYINHPDRLLFLLTFFFINSRFFLLCRFLGE